MTIYAMIAIALDPASHATAIFLVDPVRIESSGAEVEAAMNREIPQPRIDQMHLKMLDLAYEFHLAEPEGRC